MIDVEFLAFVSGWLRALERWRQLAQEKVKIADRIARRENKGAVFMGHGTHLSQNIERMMPPSARWAAPLMATDNPDARKVTTAAISLGSANRWRRELLPSASK